MSITPEHDGLDGQIDPGMIASATGMRARNPWEMEDYCRKKRYDFPQWRKRMMDESDYQADHIVHATLENIDELFDGVMIPVREPGYDTTKPGWKCKACGFTIGGFGLPPSHVCPRDGQYQEYMREECNE